MINKTTRLLPGFVQHKVDGEFAGFISKVNKIRLLNAKDAANYLSISRAKIYQWIECGKIKSLKVERRRILKTTKKND
jgi:excisionase family DNA binding protein